MGAPTPARGAEQLSQPSPSSIHHSYLGVNVKCLRCDKNLPVEAWWCPRCGLHRSGSGYLPTNYTTGPIDGPLVGWPTKEETESRWREINPVVMPSAQPKKSNGMAMLLVVASVSLAICVFLFWFFNR